MTTSIKHSASSAITASVVRLIVVLLSTIYAEYRVFIVMMTHSITIKTRYWTLMTLSIKDIQYNNTKQ
jgi:hypothetical protein